MNEFNDPAYPWPEALKPGLTIRQEFVKAAMQGLLANPLCDNDRPIDVAADAVVYADAVLKREQETRDE